MAADVETRSPVAGRGARNLEAVLLLAVAAGCAALVVARPTVPLETVVAAAAGDVPPGALRSPAGAARLFLLALGLPTFAAFAVHLFWRRTVPRAPSWVLPLVLAHTLGAICVLAAFRDPLRDRLLFEPFAFGAAAAFVGLAVTSCWPRVLDISLYRYLPLAGALALAVLLAAAGTGPRGTGARINLFGAQPAEAIKLLVVVFLASYFSRADAELRLLHGGRWLGIRVPRWRDARPVVVALAAALALLAVLRDLGPALVIYLVFVGMFVAASRRWGLGLLGLAALAGAFWVVVHFNALPTVTTRMEMWRSPWDNHRPGGVQLAHALWAFSAGGLSGAAPELAAPHLVPAAHTDLMLASTGALHGLYAVIATLTASSALAVSLGLLAWRARVAYVRYLGLGCALLLGCQTAIIAAGSTGVLPLTGVPYPFLSYGRSAMLVHFALVGLAIQVAVAERRTTPEPAGSAVAWSLVPIALAAIIGATMWRVVDAMALHADETMCRSALVPQADGVRRDVHNPRLVARAGRIVRAPIEDREGLLLAGSSPAHDAAVARTCATLGLPLPTTSGDGGRVYPLGEMAAQVLGTAGGVWAHARTVERARQDDLRGFDAARTVVEIDGRRVLRWSYCSLVPVVRREQGWRTVPPPTEVEEALAPRPLRTALDARLQVAAFRALDANMPTIGGVRRTRGAAVVLSPVSGAILASVSLPTFDPNARSPETLRAAFEGERAALDRATAEPVPPGSTFKLITAAAMLEHGLPADASVRCAHTAQLRWGRGSGAFAREVTDDEAESAHGEISLGRALVESCNVYFATMATRVGASAIVDAARRLGLALPVPAGASLDRDTADLGYGQGLALATPLELATVAAVMANGGQHVRPTLYPGPSAEPAVPVLRPDTANAIRSWMEGVVTSGTGTRAAVPGLVVGGKTGTAQNHAGDGASHSWFVGFAYRDGEDASRGVAFAFLIENGGYGGRAAATAARDFLTAWVRMPPMPAEASDVPVAIP